MFYIAKEICSSEEVFVDVLKLLNLVGLQYRGNVLRVVITLGADLIEPGGKTSVTPRLEPLKQEVSFLIG